MSMPSFSFRISGCERQTSSPVPCRGRKGTPPCAVDLVVADRDAVRAHCGRVVVLRPLDVACLEVDRLDVRRQVLGVNDPVRDDRRRGVVAERAAALDRDRPGNSELVDVARVDLAGRNAAVEEVAVRRRPLVLELGGLLRRTLRDAVVAATAGAEAGHGDQEKTEHEENDAASSSPKV